MDQRHFGKDQTRVLLMTMKSSLLEKLDQYRCPNDMTRSNAIAEALEFYFTHRDSPSSLEAGVGPN